MCLRYRVACFAACLADKRAVMMNVLYAVEEAIYYDFRCVLPVLYILAYTRTKKNNPVYYSSNLKPWRVTEQYLMFKFVELRHTITSSWSMP